MAAAMALRISVCLPAAPACIWDAACCTSCKVIAPPGPVPATASTSMP